MNFNKKRLLLGLSIIVLLISIPFNEVEARRATRDIKIWINDFYVMSDVHPFIENNRTYVPIRFIAEELGYEVGWNGKTRTVSLKNEETEIGLKIDSKKVTVNEETKHLELPARLRDDRTFVPFRAVAELLGEKIEYDSTYKVAIIGDGYKGNTYYPVRYYFENEDPITTDYKVNFADYIIQYSDYISLDLKSEEDILDTIDKEIKENQRIIFKDKTLEEEVRHEINKPNGDISPSDVKDIKVLILPYPASVPVENLSGIEHMVNLEKISGFRSNVKDLSPLRNLTKLKEINFHENEITDISPLKNLTKLEIVELGYNNITDISPLRNLVNIKQLDLRYNNINDLSPIKHFYPYDPTGID